MNGNHSSEISTRNRGGGGGGDELKMHYPRSLRFLVKEKYKMKEIFIIWKLFHMIERENEFEKFENWRRNCWKLLEKLGIIKVQFFKLIQFGNGVSWKQEKNGYFNIKLLRKLEDETRNEISRQLN